MKEKGEEIVDDVEDKIDDVKKEGKKVLEDKEVKNSFYDNY